MAPETIAPPTSNILRSKLEKKLAEYKARLEDSTKPWAGMESKPAHDEHQRYRRAAYKAYVLESVLANSEPSTTNNLRTALQEFYGDAFNEDDFATACGVIAEYCSDSIVPEVHGGTGLPDVES